MYGLRDEKRIGNYACERRVKRKREVDWVQIGDRDGEGRKKG